MAITLRNQATLSYTSCGVTETAVSNLATTVLTGTPGITKTAYDDSYRAGQLLTYLLQITNEGLPEAAASTLTVRDDLGAYSLEDRTLLPLTYRSYLLFVDGVQNPAVSVEVTVEEAGVSFAISGLPADFRLATLIYQAEVNEYAPLTLGEGRIENTATLLIGGQETDRAVATVEIGCYADLRVEKTMTPNPLENGGSLTYQFLLRNFGSASPTEVTLRDQFLPIPGEISSVLVGGAAVNDYAYDPATGQFTLGAAATPSLPLDIPAATVGRDPDTGAVTVTPGELTVTVLVNTTLNPPPDGSTATTSAQRS